MTTLVYILIFLAVFAGAEALLLLAAGRGGEKHKNAARQRIRKLAAHLEAPGRADGSSLLREKHSSGSALDQLYMHFPGKRWLELKLYRAGISTPPAKFLAGCALLASAAYVVCTVLLDNSRLGLLLAPIFGALPLLLTARKASKRMLLFEEQFPEALELLTRALRAGHSITFAFRLIGEEMSDPIGPEFAQLAEEIKLGKPLDQSLDNLAYRLHVGDIAYFNTAVMIQRETGGNLAELLDNLGDVIRDRFRLFGKVRALTSVGKATANILGIFPLFMVAVLAANGAEFISALWTTPQGHIMSAAAALLAFLGYFACLRSAQIEV